MAGENNDNTVAEVKRKPLLSPSSFFEPSPDVNYDFVSGAYLLGSVLALVMYSLQHFLFDKIGSDDDDGKNGNESSGNSDGSGDGESETMKELAESLEGIYLIFMPFIPCLLWSLVVRQKWKRQVNLKKES